MTQEALKLALEALELVNIEFVCNGAHHAKKDRHELGDDCPITLRYQTAITDIKEALAQPEQEPVAWTLLLVGEHHGIIGKAGEKFLGHPEHYERVDVYTHPPQRTEQEPVAWRMPNWSNLHGKYGYRDFDDPVCDIDGKPSSKNEPLYTYPPKRTWVGLTDDERNEIASVTFGRENALALYVDAIEAKLKDKNT
jgi:hypothetical protein